MIKNDDIKTTPKQRLIIIVVAIFMLLSTFALYAGIVLSATGNKTESNNLTSEEQARYDKLMAEYNEAVEKQSKELSDKYFNEFKTYKEKVKSFNAASVTNLQTEDIKVGTGKTVTDEKFTDYSAYYIGWLSDEKVFDSSFDDFSNPTQLKAPLAGQDGLIEGWKKGIAGMKMGGVRILTIPSALGYGENGQGDTIPANSPLKFLIMLIDKVEEVKASDELMDLYYKSLGMNINAASESEAQEDADKSEEVETTK